MSLSLSPPTHGRKALGQEKGGKARGKDSNGPWSLESPAQSRQRYGRRSAGRKRKRPPVLEEKGEHLVALLPPRQNRHQKWVISWAGGGGGERPLEKEMIGRRRRGSPFAAACRWRLGRRRKGPPLLSFSLCRLEHVRCEKGRIKRERRRHRRLHFLPPPFLSPGRPHTHTHTLTGEGGGTHILPARHLPPPPLPLLFTPRITLQSPPPLSVPALLSAIAVRSSLKRGEETATQI